MPADGLTTRQRRNRPLLIVHTGDGKGKSTAAFGLALRGWNQGWSVGVFQFVKSAKWRIGEQTALETLAELHAEHGTGGPIEWHKMGSGWSWTRKAGQRRRPCRGEAAEGWAEIKRRLAAETHGLYVLDEFTYPINWGWIDIDDVVSTLADRPGHQHVIITGRRADPKLIEIADLVTEMTQDQAPVRRRARRASGASNGESHPPAPLPRLVIAAPASGHGKTTVATGLMAALRRDRTWGLGGTRSAPTTSTPATTRWPPAGPAATWIRTWSARTCWCRCCCTVRHVPAPADVAVVEGVMGLFDGAHRRRRIRLHRACRAGLISAPVILVVDISHVVPDRRGRRARAGHLRPARSGSPG